MNDEKFGEIIATVGNLTKSVDGLVIEMKESNKKTNEVHAWYLDHKDMKKFTVKAAIGTFVSLVLAKGVWAWATLVNTVKPG